MEGLWGGFILPSMMAMSEELTIAALHHTYIIGSFFDAKTQVETNRIMQEFHAQAHKDYHPSEGMCVLATNVRSLAMTDRKVGLAHSMVNTRARRLTHPPVLLVCV